MQGLRAFARVLDFKGRSGRAEYWQFFGIATALVLIAAAVDYAVDPFGPPRLQRPISYGMAALHISAAMRRLHDRGRTGWWVGAYMLASACTLITLILREGAQTASSYDALGILLGISLLALIGLAIFLLIQLVQRGDDFTNAYGPVDDPNMTLAESARPAPRYPSMDAGQPRTAAPAASPPPVATAPEGDPLDRIERLAKLRDSGVLTDEEFGIQKAALLKRL